MLKAFDEVQAAIVPVYSMHDLMADPHVRERRVFIEVDGVVMQAPVGASWHARQGAPRGPVARRRHRRGARRAVTPALDTVPDPGFVLVVSPFTGAFVWLEVAPRLRALGQRVEVLGVDDEIGAPVVLVAHSGGGPALPGWRPRWRRDRHGADRRVAPHPGRSWSTTVPESFATRLKSGAVDGKLTPWPQWWGEQRMRELIPDDALRDVFVGVCPAVPVWVIDEVMPEVPDPPAVFVQLSAAYTPETDAARAHGWPVLVLDKDHLALLTQPDEITAAILEATTMLRP